MMAIHVVKRNVRVCGTSAVPVAAFSASEIVADDLGLLGIAGMFHFLWLHKDASPAVAAQRPVVVRNREPCASLM